MRSREIIVIRNGVRESAVVEYEGGEPTLYLMLIDKTRKAYTALDLYDCFGLLREDLKDIKFLCKGAKINVRPSSMASQMSGGLVAYELTLGKHTTREDLVHIFDFEDQNLTNDPEEQRRFYKKWISSIGTD